MSNLSIQKQVQCASEHMKTYTKARVYTQQMSNKHCDTETSQFVF